MLFVVVVLSTLVALSHQQQTCNVASFVAVNGGCPTGFTPLSATICCPAASVVPCVDLVNPQTKTSDCAKNINLCNNSVYLSLMLTQCRKTCGFCLSTTAAGSSTSTTCVDKINTSTGRSDCPQNIGLCNNATYRTLMQQLCPKTCGFC